MCLTILILDVYVNVFQTYQHTLFEHGSRDAQSNVNMFNLNLLHYLDRSKSRLNVLPHFTRFL
jgi:hypothetical protein